MSTRTLVRFVVGSIACGTTVIAWSQAAVVPSGGATNVDWPVYRGDQKGNQYSPLAHIHAANVHKLERAWEYKAGDANERSTMHVNPIVVNGVMYVTTASLKAVALNAATGKEIWTFDPARHNNGMVVRLRNRGLAHWKGAEGERIFHFVRDRVYAVDAKSGALISTFGKAGFIDLRQDLGVDPSSAVIEMTSPGAVFKNFLIVASRVNESYDASPGHIRAYDTVSGALKWTFHTIPLAGQVGHDSWKWVKGESYGGANAWGGVTIDEAARLGVCRDGLGHRGLLRWISQGRQPLRQLGSGARRGDRRTQVALPDGPARHLGLRQPSRANPRHARVRPHGEGCGRTAHEDGIHVRPRSGHGPAAVSGG